MGQEREPLPHDEAIRALHQAADSDAAGKADSRRLRALAKLLAAGPTSLATLMEDLFPDDDSGSKFRAFLSRVNGALEEEDLELASAPRGNAPATEKTLQVLARPDLVRRALRADAPPGLPPGPEYRDELFVPMRVLRAPSCGDRNAVSAVLAKDPSWLALSDADRETMSQLGVQFSAVEEVPSGKVRGLRITRLGPTGEDWGSFCATSIGVQHREMVNVVATLHALVVASHALSAMAEAADIQVNVFVPLDASLILDRRIADVLHRRPLLNDRVIFEVEGDVDGLARLAVPLAAESRRLVVPAGLEVADRHGLRGHIYSRVVSAAQLLKLSGQSLDLERVAEALRHELGEANRLLVEQVTEDFARWPSKIAQHLRAVEVMSAGPAVGLPAVLEPWFEGVGGSEARFVLRDPARRQDQVLWTGVHHILSRYACEGRWEAESTLRVAVPVEPLTTGLGTVERRVGIAVPGVVEPTSADLDFVVTQTPVGPRQGDLRAFERWLSGCLSVSGLAQRLPEADHPAREGDVPLYKQRLFEPPRARVQDQESDALEWLIAWSNEPNAPLAVVLGEYGMGKTFLARTFARRLFKQAKGGGFRLPVYIDLRRCPTYVDGRVPTLSQLLSRVLESDTDEVLHLVSTGRAVLILDGFDEKAVHLSREEAWQLLDAVRDFVGRAAEKGQQAKVLLTSRDHLFRSRREEEGVLAGSHRDGGEISGWRFCHLLPMDEARVRGALVRLLGEAEAERVGAVIRGRADLVDLASRPFLLRLIARHADRLMSHVGPLNATTLFDLTVDAWLQRDEGKHGPQEQTKLRWMEELAMRMHLDGSTQTGLAPEEVAAWVVGRGAVTASGTLDAFGNDPERNIRVAAFIVKGPDDQWKFAHRSFGEHFLARALARGLAIEGVNALDVPVLPQEVLQHLVERLVADRTARSPASRGWEHKLEAVRQTRAPVAAAEHLFGLVMWWRRLKQADPPSLRGAKLGPVFLAAQDLEDLDLSGADLSGADLSHSRAVGANLRGARLAEAVLFEARWTLVDLVGADLRGACGDRVVLDACDIDRADVSSASLVGARLLDLRGTWTASGADLTASVVVGANPGSVGAKTARQLVANRNESNGTGWSPHLRWDLLAETEPFSNDTPPTGFGGIELTNGNRLRFVDPSRGVPLRTVWLGENRCLAVWNDHSGQVAAILSDGSTAQWRASQALVVPSIAHSVSSPGPSAFSPDGKFLVLAESTGLTVRSFPEMKVLGSWNSALKVFKIRWCGNEAVAFSGWSSGGRMQGVVWRWRDQREFVCSANPLVPPAISPDRQTIIWSGERNGSATIVAVGALRGRHLGPNVLSGGIAWAPDLDHIALVGGGSLRVLRCKDLGIEFEKKTGYLGSVCWTSGTEIELYGRSRASVRYERKDDGSWHEAPRRSHVPFPNDRGRGFICTSAPSSLVSSIATNRVWWSAWGSGAHTAETGFDLSTPTADNWVSSLAWGDDRVAIDHEKSVSCFATTSGEQLWSRPLDSTRRDRVVWWGAFLLVLSKLGVSIVDGRTGEIVGGLALPNSWDDPVQVVEFTENQLLFSSVQGGAWLVSSEGTEKLGWKLKGWDLRERLPLTGELLVVSTTAVGLLSPESGSIKVAVDLNDRTKGQDAQIRPMIFSRAPFSAMVINGRTGDWQAWSDDFGSTAGSLGIMGAVLVVWTPSDRSWQVVDSAGRLLEWDVLGSRETRVIAEGLGTISCSCRRGALWLGRPDGRLFAVDPANGAVVDELPSMPCGVTRVEPVGEHGLAAVYADGTLRVWDLETKTLRWGALTFSNGKVAVFDANDELIGGSEGVEAQLYVSDGREALELSTWKRGLAYGWRILGEG